MNMIEMTKEVADIVSGEYQNKSILVPQKIGEMYYLDTIVLGDGAYSASHQILLQCTIVDIEYIPEATE